MTATARLLATTVVGSYPQPDWLIDRALLSTIVPRTRRTELWRVPAELREGAQDDATLLALRDMELAGIDIVTDGEIRRESYSNRLTTALDGITGDHPATVISPSGTPTEVPRVVGPVRRRAPVERRSGEFLVAHTTRATKITLPGPFTMALQLHDEHYGDAEALMMDLAAAVNEEVHDLARAGVDVVQLDEPWVRREPELAERYAVQAIDRALAGATIDTAVHVCFGYAAIVSGAAKPPGYRFLGSLSQTTATQISIEAAQPRLDLGVLDDLAGKRIMLGVLDLAPDAPIETPQVVADRIRAALRRVPPTHLIPAPDCGMKYLSRERAFRQLKALADGAAIVREELGCAD